MNTIGLYTLVKKEVGRFANVYLQTLVAPVITSLLFFCVFALAFGGVNRTLPDFMGDLSYLEFLAPGLIMMTMVQNAFANSSSSIMIAKIQGSIVDILMPPLSSAELFAGLVIGGILRGLLIGVFGALAISLFVHLPVQNFGAILCFSILGTTLLSSLGVVGGMWAEKFDHISAVTNFLVTPLTFLSGTFYSIRQLPEVWQGVADYNPFFYMIDGFRAGFIGYAETDMVTGIIVLSAANIFLLGLGLALLHSGYKIKS